MTLLGARVGFGAFCVFIVLSLSGVNFGGLVGQVSTASLIPELRSRNLSVFDFWQMQYVWCRTTLVWHWCLCTIPDSVPVVCRYTCGLYRLTLLLSDLRRHRCHGRQDFETFSQEQLVPWPWQLPWTFIALPSCQCHVSAMAALCHGSAIKPHASTQGHGTAYHDAR